MSEVQDTQFSTAQQLLNTIELKVQERKTLTMDELKMKCPEIKTAEVNPALRRKLGISERYVHVSTEKVIEDIMKMGWEPINAYRVKSRGKRTGTGRHMVKFINYDYIKPDSTEYPELLLTNSHDGTTSFTLDVGIFRLVCSNGMVVKSQDFGSMKVRHYGYDFETIQAAVNDLMEAIPGYLKQVDDMKEQELEREQMIEFARQAAMLRFSKLNENSVNEIIDVDDILSSERKEDDGNGLWEVFNRIQEKILNGKFEYAMSAKAEKFRKARPVKGFKQQVKLNQQLWELASNYLPEPETV